MKLFFRGDGPRPLLQPGRRLTLFVLCSVFLSPLSFSGFAPEDNPGESHISDIDSSILRSQRDLRWAQVPPSDGKYRIGDVDSSRDKQKREDRLEAASVLVLLAGSIAIAAGTNYTDLAIVMAAATVGAAVYFRFGT